jgi:hypothetical protein
MKQYVIDELRPDDHEKVRAYFEREFGQAQLGDIYWIPLDETLLSETQTMHEDCKPFYFAVELTPDTLACEFLVRTRNTIRCDCIRYATEYQRNWLIRTIDRIFRKLDIKT